MHEAPERSNNGEGRRAPQLRATIARSGGLFFISAGVLVLMGGTMTISPIWRYGPADSANASNGSQPDWYLGFLDGGLRLVPPGWEVAFWGGTWPLALLVPIAVVSVFLLLVAVYPFIESRLSRDNEEHHVLDRARDNPARTGAGAAGAVFYGFLLASAGADVIATEFHLSFNDLISFFRVAIVVGPVLAFVVARAVCIGLQDRDREAEAVGPESGTIMRAPDGGYTALHRPLPKTSALPDASVTKDLSHKDSAA